VRDVLRRKLSPKQLEWLVYAVGQYAADASRYQTNEFTYRHAMRQVGEDPINARVKANCFVRKEFKFAWQMQDAGNVKEAMLHFGFALHALQDSTSPAHHGFQAWDEHFGYFAKGIHVKQELFNPGRGSELYRATLETYQHFTNRKLPTDDLFTYGVDEPFPQQWN